MCPYTLFWQLIVFMLGVDLDEAEHATINVLCCLPTIIVNCSAFNMVLAVIGIIDKHRCGCIFLILMKRSFVVRFPVIIVFVLVVKRRRVVPHFPLDSMRKGDPL